MFTGIVREMGTVERIERRKGLVRLAILAPNTAAQVGRLESVLVNGACLSVVDVTRRTIVFEAIPETQRLTSLGTLRRGDRVHLEPSLTLSDRVHGHIVFGHVDGMASVVTRRQLSGELVCELRVPAYLRTFLVPKGPVTVDGVSLTVGRVTRSTFTIHLIPETLRQTTLSTRQVGDKVNIELDYIAKLVHQFMGRRGKNR
jgi:riboflavin synthase